MSSTTSVHAAPQGRTAPEQIDNHRLTGHQKSLISMAIVGNVSEFFDMFLIGFIVNMLSEAPGWNLTGLHSGIILAGAGLGTVLGSIVWGRLADVFGRKHAFVWCIIVLVVFTAASAFTPVNGWILLAILRTGVGFGVGGLNITSVPFVQEFVPAKQRGLLAGLTSVFIPAGIFLGGLVTKYFGEALGWRGLIAVGCIPIILLAWARIIPESPRFLQSKGREDEAKAAYAWAMEIPVEQVADLPPLPEEASASYSVIFTKYPRQLLVVALGSFSFILGSFTVQSWGQTLLGQSFKFQAGTVATLFMLVSLGDLLGRLGSAWISDRIGRRPILIGSLLGYLVVIHPLYSWLVSDPGIDRLLTVQLVISVFVAAFFGVVSTVMAELFPANVRSLGMSMAYNLAVMIFGGFAQFIVTWLIRATGSPMSAAYYVMFGVALGAIASFMVRERAHDPHIDHHD